MKKILSFIVAVVMAFVSLTAYASTDILFLALEKNPVSANVSMEYSVKLNRPFAFINELLSEEDMADIPIDIKMLAESACDITETADIAYNASADGKKLKMSASTQTTMPLKFNDSLRADIWTQIGVWADMDLTDAENPVFKIVYKTPFSSRYLVLDYTDLMEESGMSAQEIIDNINKYNSDEKRDELNAFVKNLITENMTIKETSVNKEYLLTADDAGIKKIFKGFLKKSAEIMEEMMAEKGETDMEDLYAEIEEYFSPLDQVGILGKDGMKLKISLQGGNIHVSDFSVHINANICDIAEAYGGDASMFDREKFWIDCTVATKTVYKNVGASVAVNFPELTDDNSENMFDFENGTAHIYDTIYISTNDRIEPESDGRFMLPLVETMADCGISRKYYDVNGDSIIITCPDDFYEFGRAEMTIGSDVLNIDGVETVLYAPVTRDESGAIYIPARAVCAITGFELVQVSSYFDEDFEYSSIVLERPEPDYIEPDGGNEYVSPFLDVSAAGVPIIKNGEVYVPFRAAMTEFGVLPEEIGFSKGEITVNTSNETIVEFDSLKLTINSKEIFVDGQKAELSQPIIEINGRSYFPVEFLKHIGCSFGSIVYYMEEEPCYIVSCYRNLLYAETEDEEEDVYQPEYNYLSVVEYEAIVKEDGVYYLPLWPLMGELKVRGENITEEGNKATITSDNPVTGFKKMVIDGTAVVKDDQSYTLTRPMIKRNGKNYLPEEFVANVLGGEIVGIVIYYDDETESYEYSVMVPNPLYEGELAKSWL